MLRVVHALLCKSGVARKLGILCTVCGALTSQAQQQPTGTASIQTLIRSHQYDLALQAAQTTLRTNPGDYRTLTLEAIIYSLQGNKTDASAAFDKALVLSPTYVPALKGEAQLLYLAHDKREIPLLEKLLRADPSDTTAHEMLAMSQEQAGDCEQAVHHFAASGAAINTHPASLERYGHCLMQTRQPEKAVPVFQQLVTLLPAQTYPKYDLAVLLVLTKQYRQALDLLEPLLTADNTDPDILSLASEAYEASGDTPHAVPLIRQAIVLRPREASYYVAFATLCLSHDSFQTGVDMLNAGIERVPGNSSLYISRGLLYAQLAQYDKAEDDFKAAEKLDASQTLSSYAIDLAELQRNHTEAVAPNLRTQLKTHPDSPLFHYLLAQVLMDQGAAPGSPEFQEATKSAQEAVRLKPDMVTAHDVLAAIYMRSQQNDLAIKECRAALGYDPSDQAAIYHLILALRHSGHDEEIQDLGKRLSELKQQSRKEEDGLKRYRLVEQQP